jgi:hypothetical protein
MRRKKKRDKQLEKDILAIIKKYDHFTTSLKPEIDIRKRITKIFLKYGDLLKYWKEEEEKLETVRYILYKEEEVDGKRIEVNNAVSEVFNCPEFVANLILEMHEKLTLIRETIGYSNFNEPDLSIITPVCPECEGSKIVAIDEVLPSRVKCTCGHVYDIVLNGKIDTTWLINLPALKVANENEKENEE